MPSGILILRVPEAGILAHGTADPLADLSAPRLRQAGDPEARLYRWALVSVWAAGALFPGWLYVGEDSTMIRSALTGDPAGHDSPSLGLIQ